jgi:hypothetical protein
MAMCGGCGGGRATALECKQLRIEMDGGATRSTSTLRNRHLGECHEFVKTVLIRLADNICHTSSRNSLIYAWKFTQVRETT